MEYYASFTTLGKHVSVWTIQKSFYKLRNCDGKKVEKTWQGKYLSIVGRLIAMNSVFSCLLMSKDQGRFSIHDLNNKNIALLSKWLYKLFTFHGLGQWILQNKYMGSKPLVQVGWKPKDFHLWACLIRVNHDFPRFGAFMVKDGSQVLDSSPSNISWCRQLIGPKQIVWNELKTCIENIVLSHNQDTFYWNMFSNGKFL
ncbi:hypothetical protein U9M48_036655, partial [Paspalum notatum var. saurae]